MPLSSLSPHSKPKAHTKLIVSESTKAVYKKISLKKPWYFDSATEVREVTKVDTERFNIKSNLESNVIVKEVHNRTDRLKKPWNLLIMGLTNVVTVKPAKGNCALSHPFFTKEPWNPLTMGLTKVETVQGKGTLDRPILLVIETTLYNLDKGQFEATKKLKPKKPWIPFLCNGSTNEFISLRHRTKTLEKLQRESGNVEENPGPGRKDAGKGTIQVTSYNVRGLANENKLRHLLNTFNIGSNPGNSDYIFFLQETYIETPGKIPYLWRGNYHLTPGLGNSEGCITLVSSHITVIQALNLGNRAHVLVCQRSDESSTSFILANIYAPNPNIREKVEFFERIFDQILETSEVQNCETIIIGGDFNLVFNSRECKNRRFSPQERHVANAVKDMAETCGVVDIWETNKGFTWRRPNTDCFSCIDRILYSQEVLELIYLNVDWAINYSDHAAVKTIFSVKKAPPRPTTRLTRLDPMLIRSPENKLLLENGLAEMLAQADPEWDPHMKLEFAKMSIRTVAERLQADMKVRIRSEEEEINEELNTAFNKAEKQVQASQHHKVV